MIRRPPGSTPPDTLLPSTTLCRSAGEIRIGRIEVWIEPEELDFAVPLGDIEVTECEMINQFVGSKTQPPQFTRGYGLAFGYDERKAMGMALLDRALRADDYQVDIERLAEPTSELQSLMRISYAGFCLTLDTQSQTNITITSLLH